MIPLSPGQVALAREVIAGTARASLLDDGWVAIERVGHVRAQIAPYQWDQLRAALPDLCPREALPRQRTDDFYQDAVTQFALSPKQTPTKQTPLKATPRQKALRDPPPSRRATRKRR